VSIFRPEPSRLWRKAVCGDPTAVEKVSMFRPEPTSAREANKLGSTFLMRGLRAGAEAQTRPMLTSSDAQMSISHAAPTTNVRTELEQGEGEAQSHMLDLCSRLSSQ
jgi:hypothetical protein